MLSLRLIFALALVADTIAAGRGPTQLKTPSQFAIADRKGLRDAPIGADEIAYLDSDEGEVSWSAAPADASLAAAIGGGGSIAATVPGDLLSDLHAASLIPNPLFGLNFKNHSLWAPDWTYSATFTGTGEETLLVFDSVKMGAKVTLNGKALGVISDQFLRYELPIGGVVKAGANVLKVAFESSVVCEGRWMACSGGWDWAPYSDLSMEGSPIFSKGLVKSVYLATVRSAAIMHVVPQVIYTGDYAVEPLTEETKGGFRIDLRVHLWAAAAAAGIVEVSAPFLPAPVSMRHDIATAGDGVFESSLSVKAADVKLWWPAGMGKQPLYNMTVRWKQQNTSALSSTTGAAGVSATRTIGFRSVALVTGNDTDAAWRASAASEQGSDDHGMFFRVNGAVTFARGANVVPMEEMEGWQSGAAHRAMLRSSLAAKFNMVRVWGGGAYLPSTFYQTADVLGLMVFHDMMFAQRGHSPSPNSTTQEKELRHAVRRLSAHPSIVVFDGCNECVVQMQSATSIYASFVMRIVGEELSSVALWPSCPAKGWSHGVQKLSSLVTRPQAALRTPDKTSTRCTNVRNNPFHCIEVHRPKWQGSGDAFPAVNGQGTLKPHLSPRMATPSTQNHAGTFPSNIPLTLVRSEISPSLKNNFSSESPGGTCFSSFESMTGTLAQADWGIHGGEQPESVCNRSAKVCNGSNVLSERNYAQDSFIDVYFGKAALADVNKTGEQVFKAQLWHSMIAQALVIKQNIELTRSQNRFGTLVWQLNEIWPTGGWGSIEYGNKDIQGQVIGGRWKPLQHWFAQSIFTDVTATCDGAGLCYVRNDGISRFEGTLVLAAHSFADGSESTLLTKPLAMPSISSGGNLEWFECAAVKALDGKTHVLTATITETATRAEISKNIIALAIPGEMKLSKANLKVQARQGTNAAGNFVASVTGDALAMYVTLTTRAHGHFAQNAFLFSPGKNKNKDKGNGQGKTALEVEFVLEPEWRGATVAQKFALFEQSLRIEDASLYQ